MNLEMVAMWYPIPYSTNSELIMYCCWIRFRTQGVQNLSAKRSTYFYLLASVILIYKYTYCNLSHLQWCLVLIYSNCLIAASSMFALWLLKLCSDHSEHWSGLRGSTNRVSTILYVLKFNSWFYLLRDVNCETGSTNLVYLLLGHWLCHAPSRELLSRYSICISIAAHERS